MNAPTQVQTTHDGRLFKVQVLRWIDEQGRHMEREILRHPGAVLVLGVLDDHRVVMIRNYRLAVDERLLEFPAGKLEKGEQPRDAALRELEEETGYRAQRLEKLGEFYTSPGFCDELMHVFLAQGLTQVGQRLEAGEDIHVEEFAAPAVLSMIAAGRIRDGKTIAAMLLWQSAHDTHERSAP